MMYGEIMNKRKSRVEEEDLRKHCLENYPHLTPEKAIYYQDRIAHWYRSFRARNNLTMEAMAERIGISSQHYRLLEGVMPNNKIVKAVDLLAEVGSLERLDEYGFMNYLHNPPVEQREMLQPWEARLIEALGGIDVGTRRNFTNSLIDPQSDFKQKRLQRMLDLAVNLTRLAEDELTSIETIVKSLIENR